MSTAINYIMYFANNLFSQFSIMTFSGLGSSIMDAIYLCIISYALVLIIRKVVL